MNFSNSYAKVMEQQIYTVVEWIRVGFIHGVMNTDNTTISGETIDYGSCAMMGIYDPETVYSSIDTMGRYADSAISPGFYIGTSYDSLNVCCRSSIPIRIRQ